MPCSSDVRVRVCRRENDDGVEFVADRREEAFVVLVDVRNVVPVRERLGPVDGGIDQREQVRLRQFSEVRNVHDLCDQPTADDSELHYPE